MKELPSWFEKEAVAAGALISMGFPRWMRPFLVSGVLGITLGRRVYLSSRLLEWEEPDLRRILRHELAHVRQVQQLGLVRFLFSYLEEYLGHRRDGLEIADAYRQISFEVEARKAELEEAYHAPGDYNQAVS